MRYSQVDLKKFKKYDTQRQKESIMTEIEAQIKRYKDSSGQHQQRIVYNKENGMFSNRSYDKISIDRNRMMIKDLKSILTLVKALW